MPKTTKKYGFIQPEEYENYDIQVQNQNMSRIEEELSKRKEYDPDAMSAEDALKASLEYTDKKIKEIIGTAPEALDTIYELAAAVRENEDILKIIRQAVEESAKKEELTAHENDETVHVSEQERKLWNDSNSKKHDHDNKPILDAITKQLVGAWNDAVNHITDGTKHVTSKDKQLWNTVSDKADADSVPTKVSQLENDNNYLDSVPDEYVTDTEMKKYAQPKGDYLTEESDPTVPAWAKQKEKPSYTASEIGADKSGTAEEKANEALSSAKDYTDNKIADLINGAPETMDTLKEIADAIATNESVAAALNESIGTRAKEADLTAHTVNKSNPHEVTKSQVGLGNVPNVSTNDQTPTFTQAIKLANIVTGEKLSIMLGKISKAISDLLSHIESKENPHGVNKEQVGLGNVENTADKDKSVKYATSAENASTVNGHTVGVDVPENAQFTDTKYDLNTMINGLSVEDLTPADDDYYVSQHSGGGTAITTYHRRSMKALWSYIKSKVEGLGYTKNTGTITGIKMNGKSQGTSGVVDLGTVLTGGKQTAISAADEGSNVYTFSDGTTITVKNGSRGSAGAKGTAGTNGANGTSAAWFTGTTVTGTSTTATTFSVSGSKAGDMYLNTSTYNVYRASAANSWIYVCNIKGAKGDEGKNATTTTVATASANGLMSKQDKVKLDGIETKMKTAVFFVKK